MAAACCNTFSYSLRAKSASAAAVTRYQASLRSPHNALHSPSLPLCVYFTTMCVFMAGWRFVTKEYVFFVFNLFFQFSVLLFNLLLYSLICLSWAFRFSLNPLISPSCFSISHIFLPSRNTVLFQVFVEDAAIV